jgi:hypothetical protein
MSMTMQSGCASRQEWRAQKEQWRAMRRARKEQWKAQWAGDWKREGHRPLFRSGWEIAAMVGGFVVFFPIGLAILFYLIWRKKSGEGFTFANSPLANMNFGGARPATSGNSAFDDWKSAELDRLNEERRKLNEAQAEFEAYLDGLRKAKDRAEFDAFMSARQKPATDTGPTDAPKA